MNRLIRMKELPGIVGYKPWSIYRLIRAGEFPRPVKLGLRAVAWRESDINEWIATREQVD
jgi:prophage regulatory protein